MILRSTLLAPKASRDGLPKYVMRPALPLLPPVQGGCVRNINPGFSPAEAWASAFMAFQGRRGVQNG
jgi:hypothetical protein